MFTLTLALLLSPVVRAAETYETGVEVQATLDVGDIAAENMVWTPDGQRLVTRGGWKDETVRVWDASTGGKLLELPLDANGSSAVSAENIALAVTPNSRRLVFGARRTMKIVELPSGRIIKTVKVFPKDEYGASASALVFSPDKRRVAIRDADRVLVYDLDDGREVASVKDGDHSSFQTFIFTPDGATLLASRGSDDHLYAFDFKSGKLSAVANDPCSRLVYEFAFSPNGRLMATRNSDKLLCLWDAASHAVLGVLTDKPSGAWEPLLFPDDRTLIAQRDDSGALHSLQVWDVETRRLRGEIPRYYMPFALSADGRTILTTKPDGTVLVSDVASASLRAVVPVRADKADGLAFRPDGESFLAARGGIVETATGRRRGFPDGGAHLAVSPDGARAAVAGYKKILILRFAPAPRPAGLPRPTAPPQLALKAAFEGAGGTEVLTAGTTGFLKLELTNSGTGAAYGVRLTPRLKPWVPGLIAPEETVLDTLAAGQTVVSRIALPSSRGLRSGMVKVEVEVGEGNGFDAAPVLLEFRAQGFEPPRLEIASLDFAGGGVLDVARTVALRLTVRNAGGGEARGVRASLLLGSPDLFLESDKPVVFDRLGPGESKTAEFRFFVNRRYAGAKRLPVRATIEESLERYGVKPRLLGLSLGEPAPGALSTEDLPDFDPQRLAVIPVGPYPSGLKASRDGRYVAANSGYRVVVLDVASRAEKFRYDPKVRNEARISIAGFLPDGKSLAVLVESEVRFVDLENGRSRTFWSGTPTRYHMEDTPGGLITRRMFMNNVLTIGAISRDGRRLFLGGCFDKDEDALLFDLPSDKPRALPSGAGCVESAAFSPDGADLAIGYRGGVVEIWDAETGRRRATASIGVDASVSVVEFMPDGQSIVVGAYDLKEYKLLRSSDGAPTGSLPVKEKEQHDAIAVSPDRRWVAVQNDLYELKVFEMPGMEARGTTKGGWPGAAVFLPDGRLALAQGEAVVLLGMTGASASAPKPSAPARLSAEVSLRDAGGENRLNAGESAAVLVRVDNAGPGEAHGVRVAVSLVEPATGLRLPETVRLGDVASGRSVQAELKLETGMSLADGTAKLRIEIREANGFDSQAVELSVPTRALRAPRLEVAGLSLGGTGVIKRSELNKLAVTLRNAGVGPAADVAAELSLGDADIFPSGETKLSIGRLEPGQSRKLDFEFFVNARFKGTVLPVALAAREATGRFGLHHPLGLVVGQAPAARAVALAAKDAPAAAAVSAEDVDEPPLTKTKADPDAYAVVVGIERYRQAGIPVVDYAARDAQTMYAYLTGALGFDARNVVLLQNEGAGKADLDKYLGPWLKNRVTSKSRVLVYFAGHGAPNPGTGDAYLVPYDGDPAYTEETSVPLKRVYEGLAALPTKDATVLLDSCFSGQGGRSLIAKGTRPLVSLRSASAGDNTTAIAATGPGQVSAASPEGQHGLFTYHLLKGLRGAADADRDARVTLGELYEYVRTSVEREARLQNVEQVPSLLPGLEALGKRAQRTIVDLR